MNWANYWNGNTTLYVSARHKEAHYAEVAKDIRRHVCAKDARVVDFGCGDTPCAEMIADACGHLYLCDGAATVREKLASRYASSLNISVVTPQEYGQLDGDTIDLIVANSVVQYMSAQEFASFLTHSRQKLTPSGQLILADIIPRDVGVLTDAQELLRFARNNGFIVAAVAGLVHSSFSAYPKIRREVGLLRFDAQELLLQLRRSGFEARRLDANFGHNTRRMAFSAQRSHTEKAGLPPDDLAQLQCAIDGERQRYLEARDKIVGAISRFSVTAEASGRVLSYLDEFGPERTARAIAGDPGQFQIELPLDALQELAPLLWPLFESSYALDGLDILARADPRRKRVYMHQGREFTFDAADGTMIYLDDPDNPQTLNCRH